MPGHAGQIIAGRYELVEIAGAGGMATVWRAVMRGAAGFQKVVAIKKIKSEFRQIQNYIDMFVEEARVGSELAHPNIVQVHDFLSDDNGYYLIMEWVEGMDLGGFVRAYFGRDENPPWPFIVAAGVGGLRGLSAAHERQRADGTPAPVVHRDVSPQNIMVGVNGAVKLTDFGLARARDRLYSLTAPGTVKGKLTYLSPEVSFGQPATPLSDLFSLGSVLWESLSGRKLFWGATDLEVFRRIRACDVPDLATLRPDVPERLVRAIHRALERDPRDRFASARAMAGELAEILKLADQTADLQAQLGSAVQAIQRGEPLLQLDDSRAGLPRGHEDEHTWQFELAETQDETTEAMRRRRAEIGQAGEEPAVGEAAGGEPDGDGEDTSASIDIVFSDPSVTIPKPTDEASVETIDERLTAPDDD